MTREGAIVGDGSVPPGRTTGMSGADGRDGGSAGAFGRGPKSPSPRGRQPRRGVVGCLGKVAGGESRGGTGGTALFWTCGC